MGMKCNISSFWLMSDVYILVQFWLVWVWILFNVLSKQSNTKKADLYEANEA